VDKSRGCVVHNFDLLTIVFHHISTLLISRFWVVLQQRAWLFLKFLRSSVCPVEEDMWMKRAVNCPLSYNKKCHLTAASSCLAGPGACPCFWPLSLPLLPTTGPLLVVLLPQQAPVLPAPLSIAVFRACRLCPCCQARLDTVVGSGRCRARM
jgi:hypothetical protein